MKKLALYAVTAGMLVSGATAIPAQAAVKVYAVGPGGIVASGNGWNQNEILGSILDQLNCGPEGNQKPDRPEVPQRPEPPQNPEVPQRPESPQNPELPQAPDQESDLSFGRRVFELVNEERARAGLSPLTYSDAASQAAMVRAKEITRNFSHQRPGGGSFSTALDETGVSYRGSGENIAYGQRTPEAVMKDWMNSSGHRANILNKNYTSMGVACYEEGGVNYWVQLFTY